MAVADPKWTGWQRVVTEAEDVVEHQDRWLRLAVTALGTATVVGLVLAVVAPPFACVPSADRLRVTQLSAARVVVWSVLAALATVVLAQSRVLRKRAMPWDG